MAAIGPTARTEAPHHARATRARPARGPGRLRSIVRVHARRSVRLGLVVAATLGLPTSGFAQAIDTTLWVANGSVSVTARSGNTLYIGGSFTRVGPATGPAVPLSPSTGGPLSGFPRFVGWVNAVVPDGDGGWYVGGSFTSAGGAPRENLAHVAADLSVTAWNPGASSEVKALALSGDGNTVYAGGTFASAGGQVRNRIAALDATTGAATAWNPGANAGVKTLATNGGVIYAGGAFTSIGGQARSYIAALDATTGFATAWSPIADAPVEALAVGGATIYAGGAFTTIGSELRSGIAALEASTGLATPWDPQADGQVNALVVSGATVYAGGWFLNIGGAARGYLAALDEATGIATGWNPNAGYVVHALAVNGSTVYAGGEFPTIGGQPRSRIAALDAVTGAATAWNPGADASVNALAVGPASVFAGGFFNSMGGVARNRIAALDLGTGAATAWNPNANSQITALVVSGNTVYAGGLFSSIGGAARNRIAALNGTTGAATAWNPAANGWVNALAVGDGMVYAGGAFTSIGGQARNNIAALDAATGSATPWNPGADNLLTDIEVGDGVVYVAGVFANTGGQPRLGIAALDVTTGNATAWNPGSNNTLNALAVVGSTIYAGGTFTSIGGQARNRIAALDAATATATPWNPNADNVVRALAVEGSTVYAGGDFLGIGGQTRHRVAALETTTGAATPWSANARAPVHALATSPGAVFAGGTFDGIVTHPQAFVAAIGASPAVDAIVPARGGDGGALTATVLGGGLTSAATVKLARTGEADIAGAGVTVATDGRSLTATFALDGAALGPWDVVIEMPDAQTATLAGGFLVEAAAPIDLEVGLLGPTAIRAERAKAFDVVLENLGNNDVGNLPLWITGIPGDATVTPDFAIGTPPQGPGEPDWSAAPVTFAGPAGRVLALVIPRLPPGPSVRRIYLTVPNTVTEFELAVSLTPPWVDGHVLLACLSGGGVISTPACVGSELTVAGGEIAAAAGVAALSGVALWARVAWRCEGAASLPAAVADAEQVLGYMRQALEPGGAPAGCEVPLRPRWQERRPVAIVSSVDPNDKLGPIGVGPMKLIGRDELLAYSIRFENLESATAPAQGVEVVDALDVATLDVGTLSLGPITFGTRTLHPPPGLTRYSAEVDLRPAQDLTVLVGVYLDTATGVLHWSLASLDPVTGMTPEDPMAGFLPPNTVPPAGEGSVLLTLTTQTGLAAGAVIANGATIHFDGVPLDTPDWENRLETVLPESAVLPLAAPQDSAHFTVRWEAQGGHDDLHDFSVYVSENGGAYRPWRVHVTATADTFGGAGGRTYAFYSLARDSSGNMEIPPTAPDAETSTPAAVSGGHLEPALEVLSPHPVAGAARVKFTLPGPGRAVLEVVDVSGRRLLRRDVGHLGAGRHVLDVSEAASRPGVYLLRLALGDRTHTARMVVLGRGIP